MTLYSIFLAVGLAVEAWLAGHALLKIRRSLVRLAFLALLLNFVVMTGIFIGLRQQALAASWADAAIWTFVLSHPLVALFLLIAVHGETVLRRHPYVFAFLVPVPLFAWFQPAGGYRLETAYVVPPLSWYLALCLALPLGETAAAWHKSTARKPELFLLLVGAVIIVLTGPIYSFELEALALTDAVGSNPGAAVAAVLFGIALVRGNPLSLPRVPPGAPSDPHFPPGRVVLVEELRPKASARFVRSAGESERPALVLLRRGGKAILRRHIGVVELDPTPRLASVVLATASEFLSRRPTGIVYIQDLSYVVTLSGLPAVREVILSLQRTVSETLGTAIASLASLTPAERSELLAIPGVRAAKLPDPTMEIEAILDRVLGGGGNRLLQAFASVESRRVHEISFEDIPELRKFLAATTTELAQTPGDEPVIDAWRQSLNRIDAELERFGRKGLSDLAAEPWPSQGREEGIDSLIVRSSDHWKARGLDEAVHVAASSAARRSLADRVRSAFVITLGRAGEQIFEAEVRKLKKSPEQLGPEDVRAIVDGTEAMLDSLGETIDIAASREDLETRAKKLRSLLLGMTQEAQSAA